jgi:extracellular elastinolytic metalloproteinase
VVDPVEALKGASKALALPVSADAATAEPEAATEHYVIKGSSGALQNPKARLVYFQNLDNTLSLSWRVETDISDNWLLSYVDAGNPKEVFGVVDYVSDASYTV